MNSSRQTQNGRARCHTGVDYTGDAKKCKVLHMPLRQNDINMSFRVARLAGTLDPSNQGSA
jgi:hypothetical protein